MHGGHVQEFNNRYIIYTCMYTSAHCYFDNVRAISGTPSSVLVDLYSAVTTAGYRFLYSFTSYLLSTANTTST